MQKRALWVQLAVVAILSAHLILLPLRGGSSLDAEPEVGRLSIKVMIAARGVPDAVIKRQWFPDEWEWYLVAVGKGLPMVPTKQEVN